MRYLAVLLREQSVTRAAEKLDVSQPAVSAALSRLRSLLDDELMVRGPSGISLTPRARELVAYSEELERVVDRILGLTRRLIRRKASVASQFNQPISFNGFWRRDLLRVR
jgi:DNA-binding transcriptional LysR family regulator